jgi:hypothetical protein
MVFIKSIGACSIYKTLHGYEVAILKGGIYHYPSLEMAEMMVLKFNGMKT